VSQSINRLKNIDEQSERGFEGLTKKERLGMERDQGKLQASLGGIREMGGRPDLIFVIGNDDAARAIALYTDLAARAALDGMSAQLGAAGVDLGAMEEAPAEEALAEDAPAAEAPAES